MSNKYLATFFFTLLPLYTFILSQPSIAFAAPTISNISAPSSIAKYAKYEISFTIPSTSATNLNLPFDTTPPLGITPNTGITVDAIFTNPTGQTNTQPAFIYQDFAWEQRNNKDWAYPGSVSWRVRFAPPTTGTWQFRLQATDSSGVFETTNQSFTVTDSTSKGFVRVSPTDSRYFQFEDGTYFPGLGLNFSSNLNDIEANASRLQAMGQNGVQLVRTWFSAWSIFGSAWNPWNSTPQDYDGYLPRSGLEAYEGDFRLKLSYRATNPNIPNCSGNCSYWKATRFLGWMSPQVAVKPNTQYTISVKYKAQNITGPRLANNPYGLAIKISTQWLDTAHNSGTGTYPTNFTHGGNVADWTNLTGTWNSGSNNYLPYFYLTLENVIDPGSGQPAAVVYINSVSISETGGPNILPKPTMNQLTYFDQRNSYAFDKMVELAEANNVYLRPVILEKDEYIQNHIDFAGNPITTDPDNLFYGNGNTATAVRWYQQAWWRYLQARWGYSTNIHSWELVNEGNPTLVQHYQLANKLGEYMRQFAPNHHMVSTSNWHSFPAGLWNQPFIDFADVHAYISTGGYLYGSNTSLRDSYITDNSKYHLDYSRNTRAGVTTNKPMPVIRGEAGIDQHCLNQTTNPPSDCQHEQPGLAQDTQGTWLHNYLWAQLDGSGMLEQYWWTQNIATYNLYSKFGNFSRFLTDIPLSNGHYQQLTLSTPTSLRAAGQIDTTNRRAHVWIQNLAHTWQAVVDNTPITPVTTTLTIPGFPANTSLPVEIWDTYTGTANPVQNITTDASGNLTLQITNLTTDTAFKIGDYSGSTTCPTVGDVDCDGSVNALDFARLVLQIAAGQATIADLRTMLANYAN